LLLFVQVPYTEVFSWFLSMKQWLISVSFYIILLTCLRPLLPPPSTYCSLYFIV
jgi:hypothetical protein